MKYIVIGALILIVGSLGSALYFLYHDRGQSSRMVRALAIRVALSAGLLAFLVLSYLGHLRKAAPGGASAALRAFHEREIRRVREMRP